MNDQLNPSFQKTFLNSIFRLEDHLKTSCYDFTFRDYPFNKLLFIFKSIRIILIVFCCCIVSNSNMFLTFSRPITGLTCQVLSHQFTNRNYCPQHGQNETGTITIIWHRVFPEWVLAQTPGLFITSTTNFQ